jgi:hypothetical protein
VFASQSHRTIHNLLFPLVGKSQQGKLITTINLSLEPSIFFKASPFSSSLRLELWDFALQLIHFSLPIIRATFEQQRLSPTFTQPLILSLASPDIVKPADPHPQYDSSPQ